MDRCKRGHSFAGDNLYITKDGKRRCRECHKLRARRHQKYKGNLPFGERTRCINGHEYTESNTQINSKGHRRCRQCRRTQSRKRRECLRRLDGTYTSDDEVLTRDIFGHRCFKCHTSYDLTIDHHMPLSQGFGLSICNAVLLCRKCNSAKNGKLPSDFYTAEELDLLTDLLFERV